MATYSMTLREEKGSKLTAEELDDNFLYTMEVMTDMRDQIMASMSYVYNIVLNFGPTVDRKLITSGELKNSYNSPVVLVPAQEGVIYTNLSAWIRQVNGTTAYNTSQIKITYDNHSGTSHLSSNVLNEVPGFWLQSLSNQDTSQLPVFENRDIILYTANDLSADLGDYDIQVILSFQIIQVNTFLFT